MIREMDDFSFVVDCDICGARAKRRGRDPGNADTLARREGYLTGCEQGATLDTPRKWICPSCQPKTLGNGSYSTTAIRFSLENLPKVTDHFHYPHRL